MASDVQILRSLQQLERVFHYQGNAAELREPWRMVLGDVRDEELAAVTEAYLRDDHRFFPKPGQLRAMALERRDSKHSVDRNAYQAWLHDGEKGPCPICGEELRALTSRNGRFAITHDMQAHQRAGAAGRPVVGRWYHPQEGRPT